MTGASRDVGLKGAGKGDAPRNTGPKFYENFDAIKFKSTDEKFTAACIAGGDHRIEGRQGFTRKGNKLTKKYK